MLTGTLCRCALLLSGLLGCQHVLWQWWSSGGHLLITLLSEFDADGGKPYVTWASVLHRRFRGLRQGFM